MGFLVWWQFFLLVLIRMTGLFTLSPIYGRSNVPAPVKIGLSVLLAYIMVSLMQPQALPEFDNTIAFALLCVSELFVGLAMGFITTMFFNVVYTAGQIIDQQVGFGMVQVFDVQSNTQIPVTGSLLNLVLVQCFLATDGHTRLVAIIMRTFEAMPPGQVQLRPEITAVIVECFVKSFGLSINVAAPILASGLLAELALGVIVRAAPQMNVFVIGIPIKTILGLIMISLIIPVFVTFTGPLFDRMYEGIDMVFKAMTP